MTQEPLRPTPGQIASNILLVTATILLPVAAWNIFGWTQFFLPLVVFWHLTRHGLRVGSKYVLIGTLLAVLAGIATGNLMAMAFTLSLLPAGYVLARSGIRHEPPLRSGARCTATIALCWLLLIGVTTLLSGTSPYTATIETMNNGIEEALQHYQQSDTLPVETMAMVQATLEGMRQLIPLIMPGMFLCSAMFTTWVTMVLGNKLLGRQEGRQPWPPFRSWRLPEKLVWLGIGMTILASIPVGYLQVLAINLLLALALLYCLQGFAICVYFMNKWNVPLLLRSFIYVMIGLQSIGTMILLFVGVADTWFDLRQQNKNKNENNKSPA